VATGGSIEGIVQRLPPEILNITQSINNTGNVRLLPGILPNFLLTNLKKMFEKFSAFDVDSGGRGGEYTVQVRSQRCYYIGLPV
jgi:alpha,alpha-trehalase